MTPRELRSRMTPVQCRHCGLVLRYVPLAVHELHCPVLRYPHSAAAATAIVRALVQAGQARRERRRT